MTKNFLNSVQQNINHHLWNNNGIWFIQYTIYPNHNTKNRIRRSLGTRCLKMARRYRDEILQQDSSLFKK
jgi:hypothetical protein